MDLLQFSPLSFEITWRGWRRSLVFLFSPSRVQWHQLCMRWVDLYQIPNKHLTLASSPMPVHDSSSPTGSAKPKGGMGPGEKPVGIQMYREWLISDMEGARAEGWTFNSSHAKERWVREGGCLINSNPSFETSVSSPGASQVNERKEKKWSHSGMSDSLRPHGL